MYISSRIYKGIFYIPTLVLIFFASAAFSQVTFTDNREQFLADNPDLSLQDFLGTSVEQGEFLDCEPPVNSRSRDECFRPGQIFTGLEFTDDPGPDSGDLFLAGADVVGNNNPSNVLANDIFDDSFDVVFTAPEIKAVGMTIGCLASETTCSENVHVRVFGADGLLGETMAPASSAFDSFLGIVSEEPIAKISLRDGDPATDSVQGVLNVWFRSEAVNVPTLSEWGMISAAIGLGLIGVLFAARRRGASLNS